MTIPQLVFDSKFSGELTRTSVIVIGCIFVDFLVDSRIFNLLFQHAKRKKQVFESAIAKALFEVRP